MSYLYGCFSPKAKVNCAEVCNGALKDLRTKYTWFGSNLGNEHGVIGSVGYSLAVAKINKHALALQGNFVVNSRREKINAKELLALFIEQNVENVLKEVKGSFSLALYDMAQEILYLYADPSGLKPLYYIKTENVVGFSSVPLTLQKMMNADFCPSFEAVSGFLMGYTEYMTGCLLQNMNILQPGVLAKWKSGTNEVKSIMIKSSNTLEQVKCEELFSIKNEIAYDDRKDLKGIFQCPEKVVFEIFEPEVTIDTGCKINSKVNNINWVIPYLTRLVQRPARGMEIYTYQGKIIELLKKRKKYYVLNYSMKEPDLKKDSLENLDELRGVLRYPSNCSQLPVNIDVSVLDIYAIMSGLNLILINNAMENLNFQNCFASKSEYKYFCIAVVKEVSQIFKQDGQINSFLKDIMFNDYLKRFESNLNSKNNCDDNRIFFMWRLLTLESWINCALKMV